MVVQDQNIAQDCTQLIETPGCNQEKRKAKLLLVINSIRTFKPVLLDQNRLSSAICLEYSHFIHGLGHSFKSRQSKQLHRLKTCPVQLTSSMGTSQPVDFHSVKSTGSFLKVFFWPLASFCRQEVQLAHRSMASIPWQRQPTSNVHLFKKSP